MQHNNVTNLVHPYFIVRSAKCDEILTLLQYLTGANCRLWHSLCERRRFQAVQGYQDGLEASALVLLQTCLGLAAALGCAAWGVVTAHPSAQCTVSRQYLCQLALIGVGQYTLIQATYFLLPFHFHFQLLLHSICTI